LASAKKQQELQSKSRSKARERKKLEIAKLEELEETVMYPPFFRKNLFSRHIAKHATVRVGKQDNMRAPGQVKELLGEQSYTLTKTR